MLKRIQKMLLELFVMRVLKNPLEMLLKLKMIK